MQQMMKMMMMMQVVMIIPAGDVVFQACLGERGRGVQRPVLPAHATGRRRHSSHLPNVVR